MAAQLLAQLLVIDQFLLVLRLLVFGRRYVRLHVEFGGKREIPVLLVERTETVVWEVGGRRGGRLRTLHVVGILSVVQNRAARVSVNDIRAEMIVERIRCHIAQIVTGVEIVFERLVFRNLPVF